MEASPTECSHCRNLSEVKRQPGISYDHDPINCETRKSYLKAAIERAAAKRPSHSRNQVPLKRLELEPDDLSDIAFKRLEFEFDLEQSEALEQGELSDPDLDFY